MFGSERYLKAAQRAADYLLKQARTPKGLLRTTREGVSKQLGFLDDYAFFIGGLLDLFEASGKVRYFRAALQLEGQLDQHFLDADSGGYFKTGSEHEELLARDKPSYDGAEPSGNSVMADNLLRLASITLSHERRKKAERIFQAFSSELSGNIGAPRLMAALQSYYGVSVQVIVVEAEEAESSEMLKVVQRSYLPGAVVLTVKDNEVEQLASEVELLSGKRAKKTTTAYVCEQGRCELPAKDAATLKQQIAKYL